MATYRGMPKEISLATLDGLSGGPPFSFQEGSTYRVLNCSEEFTLGSMGNSMEKRINQNRLYHPQNSPGMRKDENLGLASNMTLSLCKY